MGIETIQNETQKENRPEKNSINELCVENSQGMVICNW